MICAKQFGAHGSVGVGFGYRISGVTPLPVNPPTLNATGFPVPVNSVTLATALSANPPRNATPEEEERAMSNVNPCATVSVNGSKSVCFELVPIILMAKVPIGAVIAGYMVKVTAHETPDNGVHGVGVDKAA